MNIFLFLLLMLAKWVVSTILSLKESFKSAKVAKGVKEKIVTGYQRSRKTVVDLNKQKELAVRAFISDTRKSEDAA